MSDPAHDTVLLEMIDKHKSLICILRCYRKDLEAQRLEYCHPYYNALVLSITTLGVKIQKRMAG